MTKKSPAQSKRRPTAPAAMPVGLESVALTARFRKADLDFDGVLKQLSEAPGFSIHPKRSAARGIADVALIVGGAHAHVELRVTTKPDFRECYIEIARGAHHVVKPPARSLSDIIALIARHLKPAAITMRAFISAQFEFDARRWEPNVPLPFTPGSLTANMGGAPQIAGLDFAFKPSDGDQPIRRGFITVYDESHLIMMRVLLQDDLILGQTLPVQMLGLADSARAVFVHKKTKASPS
jgi:hypothetical protein